MTHPRGRSKGATIVARADRVEAALWRTLKEDGSEAAREQLFTLHRNLARSIARSHAYRAGQERMSGSDLEQAAYRGLLQAIDRFDPYLDVPFAAFAKARVAGCVTDAMAQLSEVSAQHAYKRRRARERLRSIASTDDQPPSSALDRLADIAVQLALSLMLEAEEQQEQVTAGGGDNAFDSLAWRQMTSLLSRHVEELPDAERTVIVQHYLYDVLFAEIATMLGVSKGRISQLHKSALMRMAKKMRGTR